MPTPSNSGRDKKHKEKENQRRKPRGRSSRLCEQTTMAKVCRTCSQIFLMYINCTRKNRKNIYLHYRYYKGCKRYAGGRYVLQSMQTMDADNLLADLKALDPELDETQLGLQTLPLIERFYRHRYRFVVYAKGIMGALLYNSDIPDTNDCQTIFLNLLENTHFNVFVSPLAWLNSSSYYCYICNKGYNTLNRHPCALYCGQCQTKHACKDGVIHWKECLQCRRSFFNEQCFQNHKAVTCGKIRKCGQCRQIIRVINKINLIFIFEFLKL